ncbi:MAG: SDR family oxidoreductase [Alphaproteobacteria bacterium]|nr:SDR family oxidoreductase [Alphaproteobacteria bacterium]
MHVLILGAAGMVGRKLVQQLSAVKTIGGREITAMTLFDMVDAQKPEAAWPVSIRSGDIAERSDIDSLLVHKPDVIFHLAGVVSGEAEQDFDKGYRVNLDGARALFEAIRAQDYRPRVVFSSSIAVFGGPYPEIIDDAFLAAPMTSYGTQKAAVELLVSDYSRRNIFDGISIRLPSVVIRPGRPNKAASSFFSGILREPLNGEEAILPVSRNVRHWMASPKSAAGFLIHAAGLDTTKLGGRRALTMPGISVTVGEMIDALGRVAGADRAALIREEPDEMIIKIVGGWPHNFDAARALQLGFSPEVSIDDIIRDYIADELGGRLG